ncbi:hypothetical protein HGQ85_11570 [Clostridioides difficile]|nr:hypothetical protein [Clostridioides difficile]
MVKKIIQENPAIATPIFSTITIALLAFFKIDPLKFISSHFGRYGSIFSNFVTSKDLVYTVNSSILVFIVNIIFCIVFFTPYFEILIRNSSMSTDSTSLSLPGSNHRTHKLIIQVNVNFVSLLWLKIIDSFGGIQLKIEHPSWVDFNVDNATWNTAQYVDDSNIKYLLIDISSALPKSKLKKNKGEFFTEFKIISNLNSFDYEFIETSLLPKSNTGIKFKILKLIINTFFTFDYEKHKLLIQNN